MYSIVLKTALTLDFKKIKYCGHNRKSGLLRGNFSAITWVATIAKGVFFFNPR